MIKFITFQIFSFLRLRFLFFEMPSWHLKESYSSCESWKQKSLGKRSKFLFTARLSAPEIGQPPISMVRFSDLRLSFYFEFSGVEKLDPYNDWLEGITWV